MNDTGMIRTKPVVCGSRLSARLLLRRALGICLGKRLDTLFAPSSVHNVYYRGLGSLTEKRRGCILDLRPMGEMGIVL